MKLGDIVRKAFHKDVGIPPGVQMPLAGMALRYTAHAYQGAVDDHLSLSVLPKALPATHEVVEVSLVAGRAYCWVVRTPMNPVWDIVLVITSMGAVLTVYLNRHEDTHRTLRRAAYLTPEEWARWAR